LSIESGQSGWRRAGTNRDSALAAQALAIFVVDEDLARQHEHEA
jgi:hypothetical protein